MAFEEGAASELFATETMAELCARQGRTGEALAIYRRLLAGGAADERRERWAARLEALEAGSRTPPPVAASPPPPPPPPAPSAVRSVPPASPPAFQAPASAAAPAPTAAPALPAPPAPPAPSMRAALLIEQPVRSGQVIYAQDRDLVVLAPVNPGAELIADGNIHVYGPLRGRAVAGAHGHAAARIFCARFEAELVGIDIAYLTSERFPPDRFGKAAQVVLRQGRCVILPLS